MKFRLVRSRAFWFGVPGLVFLLWGWWISMGHLSWVSYGQALSAWGIGQVGGEVYARWDSDGWPDGGKLNAEHDLFPVEETRGLKEDWAKLSKALPNFRFVLIPCYWLVPGYLAVWTGVVCWRGRRFRKATQAEMME